MDQPTTVWLVRHALPDGVEGRCYGRYDARLSAEGIGQARELAQRMAHEPLSQIYSSTLRRALETAQILAEPHRLPVQRLDEFIEIHFGDFEGLTYEEIQTRYPDIFRLWMERPAETKFPNGESFSDLRKRVLGALESLLERHRKESFVVVSHAGVIRLIIAEVLGLPDQRIFRLAQRPAAINRISYFDHGAVLELMNA
jgi:alpha-ribazole phosphatase/probable phosphoglycerate mutase